MTGFDPAAIVARYRCACRVLLVLAFAVVTSCAEERAPEDAPGTTTAAAPAPTATPATATQAFSERTAIFLLADSAELAFIRSQHGADYEIVADDMMWYRSEALGWLEQNEVPVVWFEGRRPLRFRVRGVEQDHDFGDLEFADVVVLYEPDSIPIGVATVDVPTAAPPYFVGLDHPSDQADPDSP